MRTLSRVALALTHTADAKCGSARFQPPRRVIRPPYLCTCTGVGSFQGLCGKFAMTTAKLKFNKALVTDLRFSSNTNLSFTPHECSLIILLLPLSEACQLRYWLSSAGGHIHSTAQQYTIILQLSFFFFLTLYLSYVHATAVVHAPPPPHHQRVFADFSGFIISSSAIGLSGHQPPQPLPPVSVPLA